MSKNRANRPEISLKQYIPPGRFRTVESFDMIRAPLELRVELELNDTFMEKLSFSVPWDGKLYAYTRPTTEFYSLCKENGLFADSMTTLYFQDWDNRFLLTIEKVEGEKRNILTFFVASADVRSLLERCCRIDEQKTRKH